MGEVINKIWELPLDKAILQHIAEMEGGDE